mgnify:CR=1 FL=1
MARRPCIFCKNAGNQSRIPPFSPPPSRSSPRPGGLVAVPVFRGRVSPVLDTCTCLILMDPHRGGEADARTVSFTGTALSERAGEIKRLGVGTVICGAVSEILASFLEHEGVEVISGVSGEAREVFAAYRSGRLNENKFRMPGLRETPSPGSNLHLGKI